MSKVFSALTEEECYLYALMQDASGIDQMEFCIYDPAFEIQEKDGSHTRGLFRAWPFQVPWWRNRDPLVISQGSRSCGKSQSVVASALAFPFVFPGQEMMITAPESIHLTTLTDKIETLFVNNRIPRELLVRGSHGIKHKPFIMNFKNGAVIMGKIPQRDGKGVKGSHPTILMQDECFPAGTLVLTKQGYLEIEKIEVGTEVWTHKNRWRKVSKTFDRGPQDMVMVRGMGHPGLVCSSNHKFWVTSETDPPSMKPANEMEPGDYWATPTRLDSSLFPSSQLEGGAWHGLFRGLNYGDGSYATTSKKLALEVAHLANLSDFQGVEIYFNDPYYTVVMSSTSDETYVYDEKRWRQIRGVELLDEQMDCFDLEVEDDHSFLVEGNFCSNSQDYPSQGWEELVETVRQGVEGAQWKVFGVTRGVRDKFYEYSTSDNWTVFRLPAMFRPTWTDEERALKEKQYGRADSPGYRKNVLSLHGDQDSAIFVLSRLMLCVDSDQSSNYNENEYWNISFDDSDVKFVDGEILNLINPPGSHAKYRNFWIGMDVGFCVDEQTEILTKRGWLKYHEIIIGVDESLAINPETHKSEWQTITDLYVDTGRFPMVSMKGQSFDSYTTPHHRWLVRNSSGNWKWKTTETLNSKESIPLAVDRGDPPLTKTYSDDFVELVAWIFTEGTYLGYDSFNVSQSVTANPEIGEVFLDLQERELDPRFLVNLTLDQLNLFLEVCNLGGHGETEQQSLARIKNFEMACALAGKACSMSKGTNDERDRMPSLTDQAMTIRRDNNFFGTIWCPTLKGHNWLARRNGSIYFTGNTLAPSAICIFSEISEKRDQPPILKLLGRVEMKRIKTKDQAKLILHLIDTYRPLAFAMDSTGVGLPLFETIQEEARENPNLSTMVERIKGYNFSQKVIAEFDDTVTIDEDDPDGYKKAEIRRSVLEHSTDILRQLVDDHRLSLPWDRDLIAEFQGQSFTYSKSAIDQYGRRKIFSLGSFHSLDACRMAALAYRQNAIEQLVKNQEKTWEAPDPIFIG